jgi:hypothetical protein
MLDELLGHPETCPHGNPIDIEATERRPAGVRLSEVNAGEKATIYRITEEAEEDAGLLSYLEARGLRPGAPISILSRSESLDSMTLDGPIGRATLGLRPAALVRVLPGTGSTDAKVRVLIESRDAHDRWGTVGVSFDIIEASWMALVDSINYKLFKENKALGLRVKAKRGKGEKVKTNLAFTLPFPVSLSAINKKKKPKWRQLLFLFAFSPFPLFAP